VSERTPPQGVSLSEAKDLPAVRRNGRKILRRYAPQDDMARKHNRRSLALVLVLPLSFSVSVPPSTSP